MKSLPQAIINGKGGGSERVILVRIIPADGDSWSEFDWATKDITVTSWGGGSNKSFVGGVLRERSFTPIKQSVDITEAGNVATLSGMSFVVANPEYDGENRFDKYFDTSRFENRTVQIWLAFWTGSNPSYSDILLLYTGVIVDVEYNYGEYMIKVEAAALKRHKEIPDLILAKEDYPTMPDFNTNSWAPLIYGKICGDSPATGAKIYAPMTRIDEGKGKFILSRNKMKSVALILYRYHDDANAWQNIYPDVVGGYSYTYSWGRPSTIEIINGNTGDAIWYGDFSNLCTHQGSQTSPITMDIENVIDRSDIYGESYVALSGNQRLFLKVDVPNNLGTIFDESSGKLILLVKLASSSGSPCGKICYYNPETDTFSTGEAFSAGGTRNISYDFGADKSAKGNSNIWTADEIAKMEWGVYMYSEGSANVVFVKVEIDGVLVKFLAPFRLLRMPNPFGGYVPVRLKRRETNYMTENLCAGLQGTEFGSWIDESGRDSSYNQGDLIDKGVYHIEALLRNELGLDDDGINVESFDLVSGSGVRGNWPFANLINQPKKSSDIIKDFCRCGGVMFLTDYQNKEKIVAIHKDSGTETVITKSTMLEKSIKVSLTSLDSVYNRFEVKHHRQWMTDSFLEKVQLNPSATNLQTEGEDYKGICSNSVSKYQMERRLEFEMDWSSNGYADAADYLTKWFADWLCYRKYVVEFESAGLDHIDLELGDQVFIDHPLLPESINSSAHFILVEMSHDLNQNTIKLKFIEIPEPGEVAVSYAQTKIVAKSGGDYTTIQGAIDAITDASVSKPYVVLIYPGIYQEAITMKAYVFLVGIDRNACRIETNTDADSVDVTVNGKTALCNLHVKGYSNKSCIYIDSSDSNVIVDHCTLEPQGSTTGYGIYIGTSYTPTITVLNTNIESSTAEYGIYITGDVTAKFRNLRVSLTKTGALNYIYDGSHEFHSCRIQSAGHGIQLGTSPEVRLCNSFVWSTGDQAIRNIGGSNSILLAYSSHLRGSDGALVVTDASVCKLYSCYLEASGWDKSCIDISGNGVRLFNCYLLPGGGTSYSVYAASAQNIGLANCVVNKDVHSNVTVLCGTVYETTNVKSAY